jgi:hypothetical protein
MSLDKLLTEYVTLLDETKKRRPFENVGERDVNFPKELRQRRMVELKSRIEHLKRRKEEAVASYDRAIALEEAEFKAIDAQRPPTPPPSGGPKKPQSSSKAARSARK